MQTHWAFTVHAAINHHPLLSVFDIQLFMYVRKWVHVYLAHAIVQIFLLVYYVQKCT